MRGDVTRACRKAVAFSFFFFFFMTRCKTREINSFGMERKGWEHQFEIGEISAVADDERARRDYRGNKNGRVCSRFVCFSKEQNPLQTFSTRYCALGDSGT